MPRIQTPTLRGEIENVLTYDRHEGARIAATTRWLAAHLGASLADTEYELQQLRLEGKVTTRRPRCGNLLWKWKDALQDQWDAVAGPGTLAGRR